MEAMERLRQRFLNVPLSAVLHRATPAAVLAVKEQMSAAAAARPVQQQELTAQQWFERGYAATDHDEQIRFFTEAIRLKPDYADAFHNRGSARGNKGDFEGALNDFEQAKRLVAAAAT